MNRVIKFRVWNFVGKCMHDWRELVEKNKIHLLASQQNAYPVMQFTGLTDKNGVEIYEGDFLKMDDLIIPVIFDDGSFQIKTNDYQGSSNLMQDRARRFEVCGNIYQNPELLK